MKPSVIICLFNHGTGQPLAEGYCPTCLQIACAEKDREFAEEKAAISEILKRVIDESAAKDKQIAEARRLIEKLGTIAHDDMAVLTAAEKWLEGKP